MVTSGRIFRVRVSSEEGTQIAFVPLDRFAIGSMTQLPVVINDPSVAKKHLSVTAVDNEIFITDQNSGTGTRINGIVIPSNVPQLYHPGDRISVGHVNCVLQIHLFEQVHEGVQPVAAAQPHPHSQSLAATAPIKDTKAELEAEKIIFEARNEAAEILRVANGRVREADSVVEAARLKTEQSQAEVRQLSDRFLEKARESAQAIERDAHERALDMMRRAEAETADKIRAQIVLAEAQMLEMLKDREQKVQAALESAQSEAERILTEARSEALKVRQDAILRAAHERGVEASRILAEATIEAAAIKNAAHTSAQEGLKNLYRQAAERADQVVLSREAEAQKIIERAQASAQEIKLAAQEEANRLIRESLEQVNEIRNKAMFDCEALTKEAHARAERISETHDLEMARMLESARTTATGFYQQSERETLELRAEALKQIEGQKAEAKDILAKAEAFVKERRAQIEAEIAEMREAEIARIEENWNRMLAGLTQKALTESDKEQLRQEHPGEKPSRWAKVLAFARLRRAS